MISQLPNFANPCISAPAGNCLVRQCDAEDPSSSSCWVCSVMFNFLGRDFFNALSEKDAERFTQMLFKWLGALVLGIPVFVFRSYYQDRLALEWRNWMTEDFTKRYFENRTFYQIQVTGQPDNPDQRVSADIK